VDQTKSAGGQEPQLIGTLMLRFTVIAAAALLATAACCSADEAKTECGSSTYEIVECQKAELAELDKSLNAAYQKAMDLAQPKQREQLRAAQRQWLKFRDADCEYYELGEGTIARIEGGQCMLDLTRARAKELEQAVEQ
jgi:uncharacterized protein YecT (DUF1311 family)